MRVGVHELLEHHPFIFLENTGDFSLWILHITKQAGLIGTDRDTGGELADLYTMITPGAFVGLMNVGIDKTRVIGAGLYTITAADAMLMINKNETFRGLEGRPHGAHLDAGRLLAVIAHLWNRE
jgi:hypothetical protein